MKVVVASNNPVKKDAVLKGFSPYFSDIEIVGVSVESGVSDQPNTDLETFTGAKNRAHHAKEKFKDAAFWVGIEGGIQQEQGCLTAFAWIIILSENKKGQAKTTTFMLPEKVADLIKRGFELGTANDMVFNQTNSKQKNGAVGLLTKNAISRTDLYKQAVTMALIPFVNHEMY